MSTNDQTTPKTNSSNQKDGEAPKTGSQASSAKSDSSDGSAKGSAAAGTSSSSTGSSGTGSSSAGSSSTGSSSTGSSSTGSSSTGSSSTGSSSTGSSSAGAKGGGGAASTDLVTHAKDAALHFAEQAKDKVGEQITQQTKRSVDDIGNVAKALKHTSEELGDNIASPLLGTAAEQVQRASDFLQTAKLDDIVGSVENFAKREPLLFLGGAFALGMLGARFLKSSSNHTQPATSSMKSSAQSRGNQQQRRPPTGLSSMASGHVGPSNFGSGSGQS